MTNLSTDSMAIIWLDTHDCDINFISVVKHRTHFASAERVPHPVTQPATHVAIITSRQFIATCVISSKSAERLHHEVVGRTGVNRTLIPRCLNQSLLVQAEGAL